MPKNKTPVNTKPSNNWLRKLTGSDIMTSSIQDNPALASSVASFEQQFPEMAKNINRIGNPSLLDRWTGAEKGYTGKASLVNTIGLNPTAIKEDKVDPRVLLMHEATHAGQPWWKRAIAPYHKPTEDKLEAEAYKSESRIKPRKGDINLPIDTAPRKEVVMPWDKVMSKFKKGKLHSGSKKGPKVKSRKQAVAIMLSEKREAEDGKREYIRIEPSDKVRRKHGV